MSTNIQKGYGVMATSLSIISVGIPSISAVIAAGALGVSVWQVRRNILASAKERVRGKLDRLLGAYTQIANLFDAQNGYHRPDDTARYSTYEEQLIFAQAAFLT